MTYLERPAARAAVDAVRSAARLLKQIQRETVVEAMTKGDLSPVTVADFAAQAVVARRLRRALPSDTVVGEESADILRREDHRGQLERVASFVARVEPEATPEAVCEWIDDAAGEPGASFWTLDPVDGTKGFLRGGQFAVALALIDGGRVEIGVLGCPNLGADLEPDPAAPGCLVVAARGEGAWIASLEQPAQRRRLRTSPLRDPAAARMLRSFEAAHTNTGQVAELADALGVGADPVGMDSQAKYALLAAGRGEVLVRLLSPRAPDYRERIWDQAAGSIVVEEAGGRITDLSGRELDFSAGKTLAHNRGVLATNGPLHDLVLKALRRIGAAG